MNIIQKCSEDAFADEYILLSKESVDRLIKRSELKHDEASQKILIQFGKWIYANNLIEEDN